MKPLTPITKFKEGLSIQGFYLCTEKYQRHTRNGDLYLDLVLRDLTGHLPAKIWDKVAELNDFFSAGDAVAVSGVVEFYQERPQLIVKKIKIVIGKIANHFIVIQYKIDTIVDPRILVKLIKQ